MIWEQHQRLSQLVNRLKLEKPERKIRNMAEATGAWFQGFDIFFKLLYRI